MDNNTIQAIQARIGYQFKNVKLLEAAFTHSSYVNEHDAVGNERIEFLGDCVLNFLVGERLFKDDPTAQEGTLTKRRAELVSRVPLARIVDRLGVIEYLQVGAGVDKNAFLVKARSDLFEALIGAVYLDGGTNGLDECRKLLDAVYFPFVEPEHDYKSELQAIANRLGCKVEYKELPAGESAHAEVSVGDRAFIGSGHNNKEAKADAARVAVIALKG
ncbi:MAG: hypothetical protein HDT28_03415 [Clostridiales bacterium]|nr:hypothetical protein [Clostridiales bacterium]